MPPGKGNPRRNPGTSPATAHMHRFYRSTRQVVARTLEASTAEERSDWGVIKEKIRADLKRYLKKHTARHPLIVPVTLEI